MNKPGWRIAAVVAMSFAMGVNAHAQRRVDERNYGERFTAITPIAGSGTARDPFRPLFAPTPEEIRSGSSPFLSYTAVLSDDRKFALVEFVARDRKAFDAIVRETRADVKKFDHDRGAKKEEIELEFRKYKKDFSYAKFKEGK